MIYNDNIREIKADPYNRLRKRNIRNTQCGEFNCGGFALGTIIWYLPIPKRNMYIERGYRDEVDNKKLINKYTQYMLKEFPDLRVIKDIKELQADEYAIAFRLAKDWDDDFHFLKRGKNGVWYQKVGGRWGITVVPKKEVFSDFWNERYSGIIVLFAKKFA